LSLEELKRNREVWERKKVLRLVYKDEFYRRLNAYRVPGFRTLEVGAGPGFYKQFAPEVIASDITPCPWHDLAANGEQLPFAGCHLDNIVGLDVVHHFNDPIGFLREASRTLRQGGRLVLIEPWITPLSYFILRCFVPDECNLRWKPGDSLVGNDEGARKDPFVANSAIPFVLFSRCRDQVLSLIPQLRLIRLERFGLFGYLLSMGFQSGCLLPVRLYPLVKHFERSTRFLWEAIGALKVLIVLEKI
jgi:SAM-dependent methyltransferase